jgi:hypothetical protein
LKLTDYSFSNSPLVVHNAFADLPEWNEIIEDFDTNVINHPNEVKDLGSFGIVTHRGNEIQSVKKITDIIHSLRPTEPLCTAHIYISFLSISNTFGWHNDDTDVFFVQAIGTTLWEVEHKQDRQSYILTPGDLIYIPKFVMHNTVPKTPRVGISIGFN